MKNIFKYILIGALPTAYAMVGLFIVTLTGYSVVLTLTAPMTIIGILVSVKIIFLEYSLNKGGILYKNNAERLKNFIANAILLGLGLTIFNMAV